jgi:hypothetical protein
MAKTFDNISEASATNYLFLFTQRTLVLQNELPTPPPLNALGLPCEVICLLWDLLHSKDKALAPDQMATKTAATEVAEAETAEVETAAVKELKAAMAASEEPAGELKAAATKATADNQARVSTDSVSSEEETRSEETPLVEETVATFTEKVSPLAKKITEYILNHQDDAAQEDRWRTIMKRDMTNSFCKVKEEVQAMHQRLDEDEKLHSKMDEKLDRILKDLASRY